MNAIEKRILQYIEQLLGPQVNSKRKLLMHPLEEAVRESFHDANAFQIAGGYPAFVRVVKDLEEQGRLLPLKKAKSNGRQPALPTAYWVISERQESQWNDLDMLRMSDLLQFDKHRQKPELQTKEEWARIQKVYIILKDYDKKEWVTREERSLELFGYEKWFAEEQGELFLRRLGLALQDLKAKVCGEPFVFWPRPGASLSNAQQMLIVENLSMFHTCKRVLEQRGEVLGLSPDVLIYGEGKKIESSLPFLREIIQSKPFAIYYAGDIDPEGWSIYVRLRRKYPEYSIQLAISFYEAMAELTGDPNQHVHGQLHNEDHFGTILEEFESSGSWSHMSLWIQKLSDCWASKKRIPQEVLTIESIQRYMAEKQGGIHE